MKRQRVELCKKIDVEKKRFQAALKEKTLEIESMRKAARRDAQEIQKLGAAVEKADVARRRQIEEVNRARAVQHAAQSASYQFTSSTSAANNSSSRRAVAGSASSGTRFRNRSHSGGAHEAAWSSTADKLK